MDESKLAPLDLVLEAIDMHFDENRNCEQCPYNLDAVCFLDVVNDLHKHAKRLKEENDKLKEENKELMIRLFRSEQSI